MSIAAVYKMVFYQIESVVDFRFSCSLFRYWKFYEFDLSGSYDFELISGLVADLLLNGLTYHLASGFKWFQRFLWDLKGAEFGLNSKVVLAS